MKQEVYSCDICKESNAKEHLSHIDVRSNGIHFRDYRGVINFDICDKCLKKKGIIVERKEIKEEEEARLSKNNVCLEDKIIDFLQDIGVIFEE